MPFNSTIISSPKTSRFSARFRGVASFLILAFLAQEAAFAAPEALEVVRQDWFSKRKLDLGIPESVAATEDFFQASGASPKTFYLIQDTHTNTSGQINLSKTLEFLLNREKDLKFIFVEAGFGDSSLSFLRKHGTVPERQRIAESYLRRGLLHGEEYLDLVCHRGFSLWGVEDASLYQRALTDYRRVAKDREKFTTYLKKIQNTIDVLKTRLFNPSLLAFDALDQQVKQEKLVLTDFLDSLASEAKTLGIDEGAYPGIRAFKNLKALEESLDFKKASAEQALAIQSLSAKDQKEFFGMAEGSAGPSKILPGDHPDLKGRYAYLEEKIKDKEAYPHFYRYLRYLKEAKSLDAGGLLAEAKELKGRILAGLTQSADEENLLRAQEAVDLLGKLLELKLAPEEYRDYESVTQDFGIRPLTGFLNQKIMELKAHYGRAVFLEGGFEGVIRRAEDFYRLTRRRDEYFIQESLKKMDGSGQTKAVLIAGGFHSANLKRLLEEKNISYVSIRPQVFHETNQARYEKILLGQNLPTAPPPAFGAPWATLRTPSVLSVGSRVISDISKLSLGRSDLPYTPDPGALTSAQATGGQVPPKGARLAPRRDSGQAGDIFSNAKVRVKLYITISIAKKAYVSLKDFMVMAEASERFLGKEYIKANFRQVGLDLADIAQASGGNARAVFVDGLTAAESILGKEYVKANFTDVSLGLAGIAKVSGANAWYYCPYIFEGALETLDEECIKANFKEVCLAMTDSVQRIVWNARNIFHRGFEAAVRTLGKDHVKENFKEVRLAIADIAQASGENVEDVFVYGFNVAEWYLGKEYVKANFRQVGLDLADIAQASGGKPQAVFIGLFSTAEMFLGKEYVKANFRQVGLDLADIAKASGGNAQIIADGLKAVERYLGKEYVKEHFQEIGLVLAVARVSGPNARDMFGEAVRALGPDNFREDPEASFDYLRRYASTARHILSQIEFPQPQATEHDALDQDAKLAIQNFIFSRAYHPERLKAIFDIYFNSQDQNTNKSIDQYETKFSKKQPGAFYESMDSSARKIHRERSAKLDYHFFIPFMLNLVDEETTYTSQEVEIFFNLFTSKKLHNWRTLKKGFRDKANLLDALFDASTKDLFRKALRVVDRRWGLSVKPSKELDQKEPYSHGQGQAYRSHIIAKELTGLVDIFGDLTMVERGKKGPSTKHPALEWRPRFLKALGDYLEAGPVNMEAAYEALENAKFQFKWFFTKHKINILYGLFSSHVHETEESKRENLRILSGYALIKPMNQDGKTLFDSMTELLQSNLSRSEVVRSLHASLMAEAKGEFHRWRYQSPDYQKMLSRHRELQESKASEEMAPAGQNESRELQIKEGWEKNQYYKVVDNGGSYSIAFTDLFSAILNMGNPSNFGSCQACYKPAYNRGLSGTLANGWNKVIEVFDDTGHMVARRIIRLRLTDEGEFILLSERTYGDSSKDSMMRQLLEKVASDMNVRFLKEGAVPEEIRFSLWKGHSEWDYSDMYGHQLEGDVGLVHLREDDLPKVALQVPLAKSGDSFELSDFTPDSEASFRRASDRIVLEGDQHRPDNVILTSFPQHDFVQVGDDLYFRGSLVHWISQEEFSGLKAERIKSAGNQGAAWYGDVYSHEGRIYMIETSSQEKVSVGARLVGGGVGATDALHPRALTSAQPMGARLAVDGDEDTAVEAEGRRVNGAVFPYTPDPRPFTSATPKGGRLAMPDDDTGYFELEPEWTRESQAVVSYRHSEEAEAMAIKRLQGLFAQVRSGVIQHIDLTHDPIDLMPLAWPRRGQFKATFPPMGWTRPTKLNSSEKNHRPSHSSYSIGIEEFFSSLEVLGMGLDSQGRRYLDYKYHPAATAEGNSSTKSVRVYWDHDNGGFQSDKTERLVDSQKEEPGDKSAQKTAAYRRLEREFETIRTYEIDHPASNIFFDFQARPIVMEPSKWAQTLYGIFQRKLVPDQAGEIIRIKYAKATGGIPRAIKIVGAGKNRRGEYAVCEYVQRDSGSKKLLTVYSWNTGAHGSQSKKRKSGGGESESLDEKRTADTSAYDQLQKAFESLDSIKILEPNHKVSIDFKESPIDLIREKWVSPRSGSYTEKDKPGPNGSILKKTLKIGTGPDLSSIKIVEVGVDIDGVYMVYNYSKIGNPLPLSLKVYWNPDEIKFEKSSPAIRTIAKLIARAKKGPLGQDIGLYDPLSHPGKVGEHRIDLIRTGLVSPERREYHYSFPGGDGKPLGDANRKIGLGGGLTSMFVAGAGKDEHGIYLNYGYASKWDRRIKYIRMYWGSDRTYRPHRSGEAVQAQMIKDSAIQRIREAFLKIEKSERGFFVTFNETNGGAIDLLKAGLVSKEEQACQRIFLGADQRPINKRNAIGIKGRFETLFLIEAGTDFKGTYLLYEYTQNGDDTRKFHRVYWNQKERRFDPVRSSAIKRLYNLFDQLEAKEKGEPGRREWQILLQDPSLDPARVHEHWIDLIEAGLVSGTRGVYQKIFPGADGKPLEQQFRMRLGINIERMIVVGVGKDAKGRAYLIIRYKRNTDDRMREVRVYWDADRRSYFPEGDNQGEERLEEEGPGREQSSFSQAPSTNGARPSFRGRPSASGGRLAGDEKAFSISDIDRLLASSGPLKPRPDPGIQVPTIPGTIRAKRLDFEKIIRETGDQILGPEMKRRMIELLHRHEKHFGKALDQLRLEDGSYRLPMAWQWSTEKKKSGWRVLGRSLIIPLLGERKKILNLVFKGAGDIKKGLSLDRGPIRCNPISINSFSAKGMLGKNPEPSHVIHYGDYYGAGKASFLNALAFTALLESLGERADTLMPLGLFQIETLPGDFKKIGIRNEQMPVAEYFRYQYDALEPEAKWGFLKFLAEDLSEKGNSSLVDQANKLLSDRAGVSDLSGMKMSEVDTTVHQMLAIWKPVMVVYAFEGEADARIERHDQRFYRGNSNQTWKYVTGPEFMKAYAPVRLDAKQQGRPAMIREFAERLARLALYHRVGGDFGGSAEAGTPKDVTTSAGFLDLDGASLPGTFDFHKSRINLDSLRGTLREAQASLGIFSADPDHFFETRYSKHMASDLFEMARHQASISSDHDRFLSVMKALGLEASAVLDFLGLNPESEETFRYESEWIREIPNRILWHRVSMGDKSAAFYTTEDMNDMEASVPRLAAPGLELTPPARVFSRDGQRVLVQKDIGTPLALSEKEFEKDDVLEASGFALGRLHGMGLAHQYLGNHGQGPTPLAKNEPQDVLDAMMDKLHGIGLADQYLVDYDHESMPLARNILLTRENGKTKAFFVDFRLSDRFSAAKAEGDRTRGDFEYSNVRVSLVNYLQDRLGWDRSRIDAAMDYFDSAYQEGLMSTPTEQFRLIIDRESENRSGPSTPLTASGARLAQNVKPDLDMRVFDGVFGTVALVLTFPLMTMIGLAIKIVDGGPVIFRQKRMGYLGESFTIYKFRTVNNKKLTRLGPFLRRSALDELPQFWNVVRGDMAIFGFRPIMPSLFRLEIASMLRRRPGFINSHSANRRPGLSVEMTPEQLAANLREIARDVIQERIRWSFKYRARRFSRTLLTVVLSMLNLPVTLVVVKSLGVTGKHPQGSGDGQGPEQISSSQSTSTGGARLAGNGGIAPVVEAQGSRGKGALRSSTLHPRAFTSAQPMGARLAGQDVRLSAPPSAKEFFKALLIAKDKIQVSMIQPLGIDRTERRAKPVHSTAAKISKFMIEFNDSVTLSDGSHFFEINEGEAIRIEYHEPGASVPFFKIFYPEYLEPMVWKKPANGDAGDFERVAENLWQLYRRDHPSAVKTNQGQPKSLEHSKSRFRRPRPIKRLMQPDYRVSIEPLGGSFLEEEWTIYKIMKPKGKVVAYLRRNRGLFQDVLEAVRKEDDETNLYKRYPVDPAYTSVSNGESKDDFENILGWLRKKVGEGDQVAEPSQHQQQTLLDFILGESAFHGKSIDDMEVHKKSSGADVIYYLNHQSNGQKQGSNQLAMVIKLAKRAERRSLSALSPRALKAIKGFPTVTESGSGDRFERAVKKLENAAKNRKVALSEQSKVFYEPGPQSDSLRGARLSQEQAPAKARILIDSLLARGWKRVTLSNPQALLDYTNERRSNPFIARGLAGLGWNNFQARIQVLLPPRIHDSEGYELVLMVDRETGFFANLEGLTTRKKESFSMTRLRNVGDLADFKRAWIGIYGNIVLYFEKENVREFAVIRSGENWEINFNHKESKRYFTLSTAYLKCMWDQEGPNLQFRKAVVRAHPTLSVVRAGQARAPEVTITPRLDEEDLYRQGSEDFFSQYRNLPPKQKKVIDDIHSGALHRAILARLWAWLNAYPMNVRQKREAVDRAIQEFGEIGFPLNFVRKPIDALLSYHRRQTLSKGSAILRQKGKGHRGRFCVIYNFPTRKKLELNPFYVLFQTVLTAVRAIVSFSFVTVFQQYVSFGVSAESPGKLTSLEGRSSSSNPGARLAGDLRYLNPSDVGTIADVIIEHLQALIRANNSTRTAMSIGKKVSIILPNNKQVFFYAHPLENPELMNGTSLLTRESIIQEWIKALGPNFPPNAPRYGVQTISGGFLIKDIGLADAGGRLAENLRYLNPSSVETLAKIAEDYLRDRIRTSSPQEAAKIAEKRVKVVFPNGKEAPFYLSPLERPELMNGIPLFTGENLIQAWNKIQGPNFPPSVARYGVQTIRAGFLIMDLGLGESSTGETLPTGGAWSSFPRKPSPSGGRLAGDGSKDEAAPIFVVKSRKDLREAIQAIAGKVHTMRNYYFEKTDPFGEHYLLLWPDADHQDHVKESRDQVVRKLITRIRAMGSDPEAQFPWPLEVYEWMDGIYLKKSDSSRTDDPGAFFASTEKVVSKPKVRGQIHKLADRSDEVAEILREKVSEEFNRLTPEKLNVILRRIFKDEAVLVDSDAQLLVDYHDKGSHKYVFKVRVRQNNGVNREFAFVYKLNDVKKENNAREIRDLKKLSKISGQKLTPVFGAVGDEADADFWYAEEFIDGKTAFDLMKSGSLSVPKRQAMVSTVLEIAKRLNGEAPMDLNPGNFIFPEKPDGSVSDQPVMVDLGYRRINLLLTPEMARPIRLEDQRKHRLLFLAAMTAQYGLKASGRPNDMVFKETVRKLGRGPGLSFLNDALSEGRQLGSKAVSKYLFTTSGNQFFYLANAIGKDDAVLKVAVDEFTEAFLNNLERFIDKIESQNPSTNRADFSPPPSAFSPPPHIGARLADYSPALTFILRVHKEAGERAGRLMLGSLPLSYKENRGGSLSIRVSKKPRRLIRRGQSEKTKSEDSNTLKINLPMGDFKGLVDQANESAENIFFKQGQGLTDLSVRKAVLVIDLGAMNPKAIGFDQVMIPMLLSELRFARQRAWGRFAKFLLKGPEDLMSRITPLIEKEDKQFIVTDPEMLVGDYKMAPRILMTTPGNYEKGALHFFIESVENGSLPNFRSAILGTLALARVGELKTTNSDFVVVTKFLGDLFGHEITDVGQFIQVTTHPQDLDREIIARFYALPEIAKLAVDQMTQGARLAMRMAEQAA